MEGSNSDYSQDMAGRTYHLGQNNLPRSLRFLFPLKVQPTSAFDYFLNVVPNESLSI